jgi:vacuolar-type H+-ATPase subunit H
VGEKLDKVVDAIHESNAIVREANEKTRERVADLVAKALKLST